MILDNLFEPNKIRTFTGRYIDPFNPDPKEIDIVDIAHALSNQCRWTGHVMRFYSIAEHSIMVYNLVKDPELQLAALLHDASEAYISDISRPVKHRLTKYGEVEARLMCCIADKFKFRFPFHPEIHQADDQALEWEWDNIMTAPRHKPLYPEYAKQAFLLQFRMLTNS